MNTQKKGHEKFDIRSGKGNAFFSQKFLSKKHHIFIVSAIVIVILATGGYFYYNTSTRQIRTEKENDLIAITTLKNNQLIQWRKERIADAKIITDSRFFTNGIEDWLINKKSKQLSADILDQLQSAITNYDYEEIFLVSPKGELFLSLLPDLKQIDAVTKTKILLITNKNEITFTDLYFCPGHNTIHFDIIAPIKNNNNNNIIANLVFRVNPYDFLYPLIQSWPMPSKSAEILLVRKSNDSVLFLNELRHQKNTALQLQIPLTRKNLPATQAILGNTGIFDGKDYRGIKVIACLAHVPESDWFLVSKVDKREIFAEIKSHGIIVSLILLLLILTLTVGMAWIYNYRQQNTYKKLWQIQEEYRTMLYSIGDAVITTDINGYIKNMNKVAENLTGWNEAKAMGEKLITVFNIINNETLAPAEDPVNKVLKSGHIVGLANHTILIAKDGAEFQIAHSAAPIKNEKEEITGVVLVFSDITDKHATQKKLQESEKRYRSMFNSMQEGVYLHQIIYNNKGDAINYRIIDANTISESYINIKIDRAIGKLATELYETEEAPFLDIYAKVAETGIPTKFEQFFEPLNKHFSVSVFSPKKGEFATVFLDVTKTKKYEYELLAAKEKAEESDRLKSAFLANMSHEIRTPMNGILGFANLLKDPHLNDEDQQKYIDIINKAGDRMLNIINDIVSISKIEAGQIELNFKESNINEQFEYIHTFFKPEVEAKGLQFLFKDSLPSKKAFIKTDREKVFAVMTNLVKNAIKYTNQGTIQYGYKKKGNNLEIFVKDSGIGIPEDRLEAIFERFVQADIKNKRAYQGAGLGLSISKAYVEMLGGKIWVDSKVGIGSTFYFTIPYSETRKSEVDTGNMDKSESLIDQSLKIIIAEDDQTSGQFLSIILKKYGKEIINVKKGTEAVEACRRNSDIDLVLMDIQMPDLNGYEASRQIREFNNDVIIIAQTAFGLAGDREKALAAGCNDYISKPINKKDLYALLNKYFDKVKSMS